MVVIERVYHAATLPGEVRDFARDTLTLGWEDRAYGHARRRTDRGMEFGTALPRGTVLRSGDYFVFDVARLVVAIVEQLEPVFLVEPRTPQEWAAFAYQIGNRHQPVMIAADGIVCPDVPGMEQVLQRFSMPYVRARRAFNPLR